MAAQLKDKIQNGLDETRMLVLGSQVLLGFQFRGIFEAGFEKLPHSSQVLKMCGLALMIVALGLLIAPAAHHRIAERGEDTHEFNQLVTKFAGWALLPFSLALGLDFYIMTGKLAGRGVAIFAGVAATCVALFFWYGLELIRRREREPKIREIRAMGEKEQNEEANKEQENGTALKDKIKHVLTEARVVLPGAQALLGFQLATMLVEGFDKLPLSSKYVHLASLGLIALATIFLMTPAAYHRIVEQGEETPHFHRFASRMVLMALVPLALGISGDFFVVARKITESVAYGAGLAGIALLFLYGFWFALPLYHAGKKKYAPETAK
ncbi:MAG: DUF6328 family protein [Pyrinomonadaceae bacterium]